MRLHRTSDPPIAGETEKDSEDTVDTPSAYPKHFKRKPILIASGIVIASLIGIFGYRWWYYASTHEQTDDAYVVGHVDPISSRVAGTVTQVLVNDDQEVNKGELLVKLDPHDYQAKVQQALANLQTVERQAQAAQSTIAQSNQSASATSIQAQGNVNAAIAGIHSAQAALQDAQAEVPVAQAQLSKAEADLQKAQVDYNRYQSLYQQGAIPKQQFDSAKAAYEDALAGQDVAQQGVNQAQAKLAEAQQAVNQAQAQLEVSQAGLQQAQASKTQTQVDRNQYQAALGTIAQAQASLKQAQLQLSYTHITAPVSGHIGNKTVEVGQEVQPGQPLLAVFPDQLWIVANFKETQVERMHIGEPVEIHLDAFPDHTFTGHIDSLSPASGSEFALLPPDNATGNFTKVVQRIPVKIDFNAQSIQGYESQITPGMSAEVSVTVQ